MYRKLVFNMYRKLRRRGHLLVKGVHVERQKTWLRKEIGRDEFV